ncbi:phosphate-import permease protein PhnE [Oxobacter pfennigii]|uniref:Phosphate-import permease protein PhnE n=1 Tax=Oxobacter pfennigii TaxID=36849 RepID=A0A0P8WWC3_9CLOT|nr:phosphate/phosphonate ABC transporter permease [Oxobacter pfennigii]KPU42582.1 phosphate-import permease protein PhnE [Oxobacter pfennigii]
MNIDIFKKRRRQATIVAAILIALTLFSMFITEYDFAKSFTSIPKAIIWMFRNFYPDAKSMTRLPSILLKLNETVFLSIASTTTAGILALFFSLFGSKTTKVNNILSTLSRLTASAFRNIPDAVWAMIMLFSFGQNALTGYFALFFVTFGVLTRAFIETIDEVSYEAVEALQATGASYLEIVFQAVIPSGIPQMISWILFMIETNIRSSTLIGILTGTGIGYTFNMYYKGLNYNAASLVVIAIVLMVFLIEFVSNYVRRVVL